jgi:putative aldouronate transport system permease protein
MLKLQKIAIYIYVRLFSILIITILLLFALIIIYPFWDVIRISLSPAAEINNMKYQLFPVSPTLDAYFNVINNKYIVLSFFYSLLRVLITVPLTLAITFLTAYPLTKTNLPFRSFIVGFIILSMFFSGGLIPSFINIVKIGLYNSFWSLVLPCLVDTFYIIVVKNYILLLPPELDDAAKIDGAGFWRILFFIIIPLSKPIISTIAMWVMVYHWNEWFNSTIYIRDIDRQVLQSIIRRMIINSSSSLDVITTIYTTRADIESVKSAAIVVSTIPIVLLTIIFRKCLTQWVMMGAIKE